MFIKKEFFEDLIAFLENHIPEFDIYNTVAPKETKTPYLTIKLLKKQSTETLGDYEHGIVILNLLFEFAIDRDLYFNVDEAVEIVEKNIWNFKNRNGFEPVKKNVETEYIQTEDIYIANLKLTLEIEF